MTDGTSAASNDAMVREFLAAWERRDTDYIVDRFTDDGVYHSIPLTPIVGKSAIREFVAAFADRPPGRLVIRHQVASDTVVMNERTDYITLNGRHPVILPICGVSRSTTAASRHGVSTSIWGPPRRPTAGSARC